MNIRWAAKDDNGWVFGETEEDALDCCEGAEPDGGNPTLELPTHKEVCYRCRGEGKHDHPAFANGITSSEWAEWDADERADYFAGVYDVGCEECGGLRVVDVIDESRLAPDVLAALHRHWSELADLARTVAAERRMGA